jgi:hypothetical protein
MATKFLRSSRTRERGSCVVLLLALSAWTACNSSAEDAAGSAFIPGSTGGGTNIGNAGNEPAAGTSSSAGSGGLPPEKELDQTFRAPVATGSVLWSANPVSGRVALIDARTLKVRMTNAGFGPTYLAAVPSAAGTDAAIVLNVGSHDATFMQATADQPIAVTTIATHPGANSWTISDDGHFAIAWTDVTQIAGGSPDPADGFSEITVIDLSVTPPESTRLSVGFRPSQVVFDANERHAYAVVDEGISVIELTGKPLVSALFTVAALGRTSRDVNIAPDGSFAIVRTNGSADVQVVDLTVVGSDPRPITLESDPTDLDLSSDGKTATAVLGNETPPKVVRFAVPTPGSAAFDQASIESELVRSVTLAPNDKVALLYANAVPSNHVTLLDLTSGPEFRFRTVDLKSPVEQVYVAPSSDTAITFQLPPADSAKKGLFSIVPAAPGITRAPKIVATDATPRDVAFSSPAVGRALVTVSDPNSTVHRVYVVGLANLEQNFVELASEPLPGATGIVPDAPIGFVAQKHPEGRITFIDLESGLARTLTGFEIAARVVQ